MASIEKKLAIWEQQGLISSTQRDAIEDFERGAKSTSPWWLYSMLILGAAIVGLGVISLIAANWAQIPDNVKLGADFALLASLAGLILRQQRSAHSPWFDALIMAFIIVCLASIGLIAQIYHINGRWYHALLLWSVMTLPLILFARGLAVQFFWATLSLHALVWSSVDLASGSLRYAFREIPALLLLAPLMAALLYMLTHPTRLLRRASVSFFFWFQITALIALVTIDLLRSNGDLLDVRLASYAPAWIASGLLAALIVFQSGYRPLNKALLLIALGLLLVYFHPDLLFSGQTRYTFSALEGNQRVSLWLADDIRAPILTILILFLYAVHAGNSGYHRAFNLITFLIGLRFVVLYFQAMGGLAATGVGLILSGLMIIGIAWFWYSSRERLKSWSQELTQ